MPDTPIKMTVSLSLNANLWILFRKTCREQGLVPSHAVEAFMQQQLAAWQPHIAQEPDHA